MKKLCLKFLRDADGQDLVEYALLAGVIALGVVAAMQGVRDGLSNQLTNVSTALATGS